MNALKSHKKCNHMIAKQERQSERERIEKMSPEEREQYEKEKAESLEKIKKDMLTISELYNACRFDPYYKE